MTTRIEVDFNSRDEAGTVPALIADADGPVRVGDSVEAYDAEGYRCPAVVTRVGDEVLPTIQSGEPSPPRMSQGSR